MQSILKPAVSLVIPVYGNEGSIGELITAVRWIDQKFAQGFEAVFVVDGSPDRSYALLREALPTAGFNSQLITLSRNFGAFAAIRNGLEHAQGEIIAAMAADLQEPPEVIVRFVDAIQRESADVVLGVREGREDPWLSKVASFFFWKLYRHFVMPEIPQGGVDIFALSREFRDRLLMLGESNSSLLAQIFWLGGRRTFVGYRRLPRKHGKSAWSLRKKLRYLSDSIFAFTDLPVRILISLGLVTMAITALLFTLIVAAKISGLMAVPGYAGTMVTILFFGAFNSLGLGVVGSYAWRTFENTKSRPLSVTQSRELFGEVYQ